MHRLPPTLAPPSAIRRRRGIRRGDRGAKNTTATNRAKAPVGATLTATPWVARFFYARPEFSFEPGDSTLATFCLALEGDLRLQAGEGPPQLCRSVLLTPGAGVRLCSETAAACLYVEPGGIEFDLLRAGMSDGVDSLPVKHHREGELSAILRDILDSTPVNPERSERIAQAFGLSGPRAVDWRIAQAIRLIRDDPSLSHRAEVLARQVGLSESRFRHAFREATGLSLTRFRVWTRLRTAMSLASEGNSLTHAAYEAGFSSSAHLSSVHRSMFGLTPSSVLAAGRTRRSLTAALAI